MESLDLVVKIGSMALIQKDENAIDYNIFQRLGRRFAAGHDPGHQRCDRNRTPGLPQTHRS